MTLRAHVTPVLDGKPSLGASVTVYDAGRVVARVRVIRGVVVFDALDNATTKADVTALCREVGLLPPLRPKPAPMPPAPKSEPQTAAQAPRPSPSMAALAEQLAEPRATIKVVGTGEALPDRSRRKRTE